jgi:non-ribosomal peptide synthetase component F
MLTRQEHVTPYMLLLASFQILLGRHSGQTDVLVGSPIAHRAHAAIEGVMGCFVNTLVLRTSLGGGPSVRQLLQRVRETALDAYAHQDVPFELLVDTLAVDRDPRRSPLVQAMFALDNTPPEALHLAGVSIEALDVGGSAAHFDLGLTATARGDAWHASLTYSTDLFESASAQRLLHRWQTLVDAIATDPGQRVDALPLLSPAERAQVLTQWIGVGQPASHTCVHTRLEMRADQQPDAVAVVCGDLHLTQAGLHGRANQLARALRRRGVGPETRVGLCVDRSADAAIGLIGILKAGAAYVPRSVSIGTGRRLPRSRSPRPRWPCCPSTWRTSSTRPDRPVCRKARPSRTRR